MKINFNGPLLDSSGYGELSRLIISGLHDANTEIAVKPIMLESANSKISDFGHIGELCSKLLKTKAHNSGVNIICTIPRLFSGFKKIGMFNVGITMFEGSKLPSGWVQHCNEMDMIIVPSQWNKDIFINSGVTCSITVWKPGINIPTQIEKNTHSEDKYRFYSIFEWTERKNPSGLLKAYWSAFTGRDDVVLTIKTSRKQHSSEQSFILNEIDRIKKTINLQHYPEVKLVFDKLSSKMMHQLHLDNDCFVLPHRCEGLGLPLMEAMAIGNPTIATGYSGNLGFMKNDNSYLLDYHLTPIFGMDYLSGFYTGDMWWAEPDLFGLSEIMKKVVIHQDEALKIGSLGREHLIENFQNKDRINELLEILKIYTK